MRNKRDFNKRYDIIITFENTFFRHVLLFNV